MTQRLPGSFRDPAGFLFEHQGELYRRINKRYLTDYQALMDSGLYKKLTSKGLLVSHKEVTLDVFDDDQLFRIIQPERISTISYPYEWSFNQLKDAALLTLSIQRMALAKNMSLKDASAYNVQFHQGRPVFIDTLSFEQYRENRPWVAYRQFCQHFLAPLALMAKTDISLNQLLRTNIDGVPLQLASKLLPWNTRLQISLGLHIHLHARSQQANADKAIENRTRSKAFTRRAFLALIDNLTSAIKSLKWQAVNTEWFDYYDNNNNYLDNAIRQKDKLVAGFIESLPVHSAWDLGANTGRFSRIAGRFCDNVCAWDIDPACVDLHYQHIKKHGCSNVLPLLLDMTNPSPAIGWNNDERAALKDRAPVDIVLALGLVHHLAISNNLPLEEVAAFLKDITHYLVIEFVPKNDSQVIKLLKNRDDIFDDYNEAHFEAVFSRYFTLRKREAITDSKRLLYLFEKS